MRIALLLSLLFVGGSLYAQKWYVQIDSLEILKLKAGKTYTLKTAEGTKEYRLVKLEADTFVFEGRKLYFKDIKALKNPKRKGAVDVIAFPLVIGSCMSMTAIPIMYFSGYFLTDINLMLRATVFFLAETILFYKTREYFTHHKKWLKIGQLEGLNVINSPK